MIMGGKGDEENLREAGEVLTDHFPVDFPPLICCYSAASKKQAHCGHCPMESAASENISRGSRDINAGNRSNKTHWLGI